MKNKKTKKGRNIIGIIIIVLLIALIIVPKKTISCPRTEYKVERYKEPYDYHEKYYEQEPYVVSRCNEEGCKESIRYRSVEKYRIVTRYRTATRDVSYIEYYKRRVNWLTGKC
jgi:hypothetical protein